MNVKTFGGLLQLTLQWGVGANTTNKQKQKSIDRMASTEFMGVKSERGSILTCCEFRTTPFWSTSCQDNAAAAATAVAVVCLDIFA